MARTGDRTGAPSGASAAVIDETHADVTFSNTSVEQTYASFTLPANAVKVGDQLRLRVSGELTNNSAGAITYTPRFKLGATTVLSNGASIGNAANPRKVALEYVINIESLSAQRCSVAGGITTATTSSMLFSASNLSAYGSAAAAEDLTSAKTLAFTVQMASADAAASFTLRAASLMLVRKAPLA